MHDADVFCDGLDEAIQTVADGEPWAVPHHRVRRLTEAATARYIKGDIAARELEQLPYLGVVGGGILVAWREVIRSIPLDSRFVGWGKPARRTSRGAGRLSA